MTLFPPICLITLLAVSLTSHTINARPEKPTNELNLKKAAVGSEAVVVAEEKGNLPSFVREDAAVAIIDNNDDDEDDEDVDVGIGGVGVEEVGENGHNFLRGNFIPDRQVQNSLFSKTIKLFLEAA